MYQLKNMTATTRLSQSALSDTTRHLASKTREKMLWCDPHAGGFLHHGNTRFITQPRTPKLAQVSSWTCGDWHERSRLACLCVQTSAENTSWLTAPLIAIVTSTGAVTIQHSAPTQNLSFETLEQVLYGCPVVWSTMPASRGIVEIKVLRLPNEHLSCAHRQSHLQS